MNKILLLAVSLILSFTTVQAQLIKSDGADKPAWKAPVEDKYLAGAVPVVDGMVTFSRDIEIPTAGIQDPKSVLVAAKHWVGKQFARPEVNTRKNLDRDTTDLSLKVGINEYMVFTSRALSLDRTQFIYSLAISVEGGKLHVVMSDITYYYEEDRAPEKYTAEEWITDEEALTKNGKKFYKGRGKFRTKTIDAFDDFCTSLHDYLWQALAK